MNTLFGALINVSSETCKTGTGPLWDRPLPHNSAFLRQAYVMFREDGGAPSALHS